jgi:hypothetical protein
MRTRRDACSLVVFTLALVLAGCSGGTYAMKEVPFAPPEAPRPGETLIYVFREDSAFGAARKLAIIDNDTVVAVLTPGTFSQFTVPTGEHEIVGYMSPSPVMHYRVTQSHGRTVYLYCKMGYASGMFMEPIDETTARPLIARFKYTEIDVKNAKAKMDYKAYYDKLYK